jgi:hypothetical protein
MLAAGAFILCLFNTVRILDQGVRGGSGYLVKFKSRAMLSGDGVLIMPSEEPNGFSHISHL